jgi:uncharacterized membrane protein YdbT with pleckstrin-like domain
VPFPKTLLNDAEEVVLDLRPHWLQLFLPTVAFVVAVAAAIWVNSAVDSSIAVYAGLAIPLVALAWLGVRYAKWVTTTFVVTTQRLVYRYGVLAKHGREIPLDRLNDISFHQSLFERVIGAGDLMIESAGEHGQTTFSDVRRPSFVQNEIYRQIESVKDRDAGRHASGPRELSVPEQIDQLDQLRQRGVISQAEFDAKKQQLLQRM